MVTKKKQKSEIKRLFNKAWKLMSQLVRTRDTDWRGYGNCITCNKKIQYKEAHAGHFHHGYLDFDERNINLQCSGCNTYRGGALDLYSTALIRLHGTGILEKLLKARNKQVKIYDKTGQKYTVKQLEKIIEELNDKINNLSRDDG